MKTIRKGIVAFGVLSFLLFVGVYIETRDVMYAPPGSIEQTMHQLDGETYFVLMIVCAVIALLLGIVFIVRILKENN